MVRCSLYNTLAFLVQLCLLLPSLLIMFLFFFLAEDGIRCRNVTGVQTCALPILLRNLSVVEGMDVDALLAGTRWDFETFAQYLDMIERRRPLGNVAVLAQHSTIRNAVMGEERAEERRVGKEGKYRVRADSGSVAR